MRKRKLKKAAAWFLSSTLLLGSASLAPAGMATSSQASETSLQATTTTTTPGDVSAVDFTKVKITDAFWGARQKQVVCSILDVGILKVEATNGGFNNFIQATKKNKGETAKAFEGDVYFLDSDAYKMIEAMSYGLQIESDGDTEIQAAQKKITTTLNKWIPYIVGAQESDGYLDTFFTLDRGTQSMSATTSETNKWTDFAAHELYVDGHFYEAAVALYRANGDTRLLDAAIKNADLIQSIFGEGGTKKATSGHQEIELGLLKLAKRFLDLRGDTTGHSGYYSFAANNPQYRQDHTTVANQTTAVGHVVRAMYQYIAMTDVCLLTGSYTYDKALTSLWNDITQTKSYITGGMGIANNNESFGSSYDLPVNGAYSETCGSIGSFIWNQKMNMLYGDSKYADTMETTLYNAIIDGVNFDGNKFFYQNPISSDGTADRSAWFGCACCPPNLMRLINSLGSYLYTQDADGINVNLYMGNEADLTIKDTAVTLKEESDMPWKGNVSFTVSPEKEVSFALRLRVPSWANGKYTLKVNNSAVSINFDMPIVRTHRSDKIQDTKGYTAIQKGPVVYVAEAADNDFNLDLFTLPANAALKETYTDNLVGGSDPYKIKGGLKISGTGTLQTIQGTKDQTITLIPYYAWDNRGKGIMRTYINESNTLNPGLESFAHSSASYTSIWQSIDSLNDGDETTFWCSWILGSIKENPWVQYEFDETVTLSGCRVNWFEDTADTRMPTGLKIEYRKSDGTWQEVTAKNTYDTFLPMSDNDYLFEDVDTTAIRMTLTNKSIGTKMYALGINEWKLIGNAKKTTVTPSVPSGNKTTVTNTSSNQTTQVSSSKSTTAKKVTLAKVKKVKAKRTKKGVKLSYKKVSKASGYQIYRSTKKKKGYKKIATTKKLSYNDTKAKKSKTYYYKVRAIKKQNKKTIYGSYSAVVKVKKKK